MSERTSDAKHKRDQERERADDRVDEAHVAGALDEHPSDERADGVRRPCQDHRDADDSAEHLVRHDGLAKRRGVDVEENSEA